MIMRRFSFILTLLLAALTACGGGGYEDPQPRIEMVEATNQWPDIYPKARLIFDSDRLIGFSPELASGEEVDRVCWIPYNRQETPASMACGTLQKGSNGKLSVDVALYYILDEGNFIAFVKGRNLSPSMDVSAWQLPPKWGTFLGFRSAVYLRYDLR